MKIKDNYSSKSRSEGPVFLFLKIFIKGVVQKIKKLYNKNIL